MAREIRSALIKRADKVQENMQDWNFVVSLIELKLIEKEYKEEYFRELIATHGLLDNI
jgi:hypothetical protein